MPRPTRVSGPPRPGYGPLTHFLGGCRRARAGKRPVRSQRPRMRTGRSRSHPSWPPSWQPFPPRRCRPRTSRAPRSPCARRALPRADRRHRGPADETGGARIPAARGDRGRRRRRQADALALRQARPAAAAPRHIRRGMVGWDVSVVQFAHRRGLRVGGIDGIYGRATQQAVRRFQSHASLAADGIVGPATTRALTGGRAKHPAVGPGASRAKVRAMLGYWARRHGVSPHSCAQSPGWSPASTGT